MLFVRAHSIVFCELLQSDEQLEDFNGYWGHFFGLEHKGG